jgi:hypothetical protein
MNPKVVASGHLLTRDVAQARRRSEVNGRRSAGSRANAPGSLNGFLARVESQDNRTSCCSVV